jgi:hypothetical protein
MVLLALDCVLTHCDERGRYHFIYDTTEAAEKAAAHGLADNKFAVKSRYSLAEYIGKPVRVRVNCARYTFVGAGGAVKTGVRVTSIGGIEEIPI